MTELLFIFMLLLFMAVIFAVIVKWIKSELDHIAHTGREFKMSIDTDIELIKMKITDNETLLKNIGGQLAALRMDVKNYNEKDKTLRYELESLAASINLYYENQNKKHKKVLTRKK